MRKLLITMWVLVVTLGSASLAQAAGTVVVTGDTATSENQPGWLFNRDTGTSTSFDFMLGNASLGQGSLYVFPIGSQPSDKFVAEYFLLTPIAEVHSLSYDFRIAGEGTAGSALHYYMNVYANFGESPDNKFYDCRYNVIPTRGSISEYTTVTFDPTHPYPVTTSSTAPHDCPDAPADMNEQSANSTIRAIAINMGDTSSNDRGLAGYFDNVIVQLASDGYVFDFEPVIGPVTNKDQCKNNGWKIFNTPAYQNQGECVSSVVSNSEPEIQPKEGA